MRHEKEVNGTLSLYMSNNRRQRVEGEKSTHLQKKIPWHARLYCLRDT